MPAGGSTTAKRQKNLRQQKRTVDVGGLGLVKVRAPKKQVEQIKKKETARAHPTQPGVKPYLGHQGKKLSPKKRLALNEKRLTSVAVGKRVIAPPGSKSPTKPNVDQRQLQKLSREQAAKEPKKTFGVIPAAAVGRQVSKELEGSGALAAASKALGKALTADTMPHGSSLLGKTGDHIIKNATKDLVDLPANALPAVYLPAKAVAKDIAHGPYKPHSGDSESTKLLKSFAKSDPAALAVQGKFKQAAKAAEAHPLNALLEARGIKSAVGRTAGATMRAIPGPTRAAASTKRAPLKVHGNIEEPRSYSKDVITKATQRTIEKVKARRGQDPNQATPHQIERKLKRRMNEEVSRVENTRRANRDKITHEWGGKNTPHPIAPFVGTVARRPDTALNDLAAYRNHLKRLDTSAFSKAERAAHDQLIKQVEHAIKKGDGVDKAFAQAKEFKKAHAPSVAALVKTSDLEPAQARMAPLVPYARLYMGAKWDEAAGHLVAKNGTRLTAGQIERHMLANKVPIPGYLSQKPNFRGAKNFFVNSQSPQHNVAGKSRTGEATIKGTYDAAPEVMHEQLVRSQGLVDAIKGHDETLKLIGVRPAKGKYYRDFEEARKAADELSRDAKGNRRPDATPLVPVRISPFAANKSLLNKIKTGHEADDHMAPMASLEAAQAKVGQLVDESLRPGPGKVVLAPKAAVDQLRALQPNNSSFDKGMQAVQQTFKQTVLPTSTKWLFGNLFDNYVIRAGSEGLGPKSAITGHRILKSMERQNPEAAQAFRARTVGGTMYGSVARTSHHREASQLQGGTVQGIARAMGALRRTPGPKQLVDVYQKYADFVFNADRVLEAQPQYAKLGKLARQQVRETTGQWHKAVLMNQKMIDEVARGWIDPNTQVALARENDKTFGQWDKNGPTAKKLLADYAPFGMWLRAASKYVLVTFPKDHPVQTGILAALNNMTREERQKFGLVKGGDGAVPDFLQGSLPTDKGLVRFGGYSSFGFFNDYPGNLSSSILPQFGGLDQLRGINFKGQQIKNADGTPLTDQQRFLLGLYSQMEAWLPLVSIGRRVQEKGGTPTDFSTIFKPQTKPGTKKNTGAALNKIFNPVAPVNGASSKPSSSKITPAKGGGGFGGGGGFSGGFGSSKGF